MPSLFLWGATLMEFVFLAVGTLVGGIVVQFYWRTRGMEIMWIVIISAIGGMVLGAAVAVMGLWLWIKDTMEELT